MRRSTDSNTASATTIASTTTPPPSNGTPFSGLVVEVVPVPEGFTFRVASDGAWNGAKGVFRVELEYAIQTTNNAPKSVVIYEPEAEENMTLQKTILSLSTTELYIVKLKLLDATGITLCALQFRSVQPLP